MKIVIQLTVALVMLLAVQSEGFSQSDESVGPGEAANSELLEDSSSENVALTGFHNACDTEHCPADCDALGNRCRAYVCAGDFPHSFLIPGSSVSMKIGGYAKADFIRDFDAIGNTDKFDTTTIPTDGTDDENWRLHARQTRLNLDLRGPTALGDGRGFVEIDFFSDQDSLRLRHAYAEVGPLLAGQTWTTFMDPTILPVILDYENPIGMIFDRRAMLRWTRPIHAIDGLQYSLAIEDPKPVFSSAAGVYESELPDLVGRFRYEHNRFHVQLAGFGSSAKFTPTVGQETDDTAWGISFTGTLKVCQDDFMGFQYSRGDGMEGFRGFQRYDLTPGGAIEAVPSTLWMATYHHFWSSCLQSTLVYARADIDSVSQVADSIDSTDYASLNLIWKADDRVQMGLEYLHGTRTDFDASSGTANRLQFAVWYFLP